jgi:hypothetical protein
MSEDQVTRNENTSIPEYAATRGARLERVLDRASDAPLREGNRLELLKNGPKTYDGHPSSSRTSAPPQVRPSSKPTATLSAMAAGCGSTTGWYMTSGASSGSSRSQ